MATATKRDVILLNYSESGQVTVQTKDEDRFVMTAQKAVEACQEHKRQSEAIKFFKQNFLTPIRRWCVAHSESIKGCYVPPPNGCLEVFVIGNAEVYDTKLSRELSELELTLADGGWHVSMMLIPDCPEETLRAYFSPDGAIEVYAESEPASQQGEV